MKKFVLAAVCFICVVGFSFGDVVRQESTQELKKVVYTGNFSECPQVIYCDMYYYAKIVAPEITLGNMPIVQVYTWDNDGWDSWEEIGDTLSGDPSDLVFYTEGTILVHWKVTYERTSIYWNSFKIVIIYESGLKVENTGTGKSTELNWIPLPGRKIEGYNIWRREKTE